jgi:hypothetical protein
MLDNIENKPADMVADHPAITQLRMLVQTSAGREEADVVSEARSILNGCFDNLRADLMHYGEHNALDERVGEKGKNGVLIHRWFIVRNREKGNTFLHHFQKSDDDRALHDHPWASLSVILQGCYLEYLPDGSSVLRQSGDVLFRHPSSPHRIELVPDGEGFVETWTLFITGPKVIDWGFYCPQGWKPWQEYTEGSGCGDF